MQRTEPELERSATEQLAKRKRSRLLCRGRQRRTEARYVYFEDEPGRRHQR